MSIAFLTPMPIVFIEYHLGISTSIGSWPIYSEYPILAHTFIVPS